MKGENGGGTEMMEQKGSTENLGVDVGGWGSMEDTDNGDDDGNIQL